MRADALVAPRCRGNDFGRGRGSSEPGCETETGRMSLPLLSPARPPGSALRAARGQAPAEGMTVLSQQLSSVEVLFVERHVPAVVLDAVLLAQRGKLRQHVAEPVLVDGGDDLGDAARRSGGRS